MKRLLLPLLAAITLPSAVNAEKIDPEIVKTCMKAVDFQGCVNAMTGKSSNNNDIEVKTDIGEKFIVMDSTVTEINITEFKKKQNLWQEVNSAYSIYSSAIEDSANCAIEERKKYDYLKDVPLGNPPPKTIYEIRENSYTWKPKYQKFYQRKLSANCGSEFARGKRKTKDFNKAKEEWTKFKNKLKDFGGIDGDINNIKKFKFRPILEDLNGKKVGLDYEVISCVNKNLSIEEQTKLILLSGEIFPYIDGTAIQQMKQKVCDKYAKF